MSIDLGEQNRPGRHQRAAGTEGDDGQPRPHLREEPDPDPARPQHERPVVLSEVGEEAGSDEWNDSAMYLDYSFTYLFDSGLELFLQANNLTEEVVYLYRGHREPGFPVRHHRPDLQRRHALVVLGVSAGCAGLLTRCRRRRPLKRAGRKAGRPPSPA